MNYSTDDQPQGEVLYDSPVSVRFIGVYDLVEDRPRMAVVGRGRTVDEAWVNACDAVARETSEMTYDDWTAA